MWEMMYISGRPGFYPALLRHLQTSHFPFLPGSAEGNAVAAIWINQDSSVKDLKYAIGSKLIFKYRLRFYANHAELSGLRDQNDVKSFTRQEREMIREMIAREEMQRKSA